jgi:hypothetical protein
MAIMPEEQNLQMQVTRLLKSWKILSMKCVYKFWILFGRMDVMYNSFRIRKWKNFFVVELNGAASEPTHIYDPNTPCFLHGRN